MIEVRIPLAVLNRFDNDVHAGVRVLEALREAGVPVRGALFPRGVDTGTLTVTDDALFEDQVWTWVP